MYEKSHLNRASQVDDFESHSASSEMPLFDRQYHLPLVICSKLNNVSMPMLHRFRDITTFTVPVTACDLESPSFSRRQLKLGATCAIRFTCKHIMLHTYFPRYRS